ncbi:hypothetical protein TSOC_000851 [Tetrabaena socialis]|uniref:Uncharacterized protein n=1 Tax=Tetrabaena socialis TaxID=47790 RepID=A0A2J8AI89_9CHLO|nr:hypothetical protein TSOC_000851 [Tetrabaena socialis]|eukprot:PNH12232.1 hypothetical protein TSOC_000851 [Tetrabaena socialis]
MLRRSARPSAGNTYPSTTPRTMFVMRRTSGCASCGPSKQAPRSVRAPARLAADADAAKTVQQATKDLLGNAVMFLALATGIFGLVVAPAQTQLKDLSVQLKAQQVETDAKLTRIEQLIVAYEPRQARLETSVGLLRESVLKQ